VAGNSRMANASVDCEFISKQCDNVRDCEAEVEGVNGAKASLPAGHDEVGCAALAPPEDEDALHRLAAGVVASPHSSGLLHWKVFGKFYPITIPDPFAKRFFDQFARVACEHALPSAIREPLVEVVPFK